MTRHTLRRSLFAALPLIAIATAAAQTPQPSARAIAVRPWTREQVTEFVVKAYPTIVTGDTAIGHIHILLDARGQLVRTVSGKSDSVQVSLGTDQPTTGHPDGARIKKSPTGQSYIEPMTTPLSRVSYGLDDIDPKQLNGAFIYGFSAGEIGPRRLVATVLVLKPVPKAATTR